MRYGIISAQQLVDADGNNPLNHANLKAGYDHSQVNHAPEGAESNPDLISQAEAEAGISTTERMFNALRVKQAITSLAGGGPTLAFPKTVVFTGNSPTSFTDLNLSSVVGVNSAIVIIKIKCDWGNYIIFRTNGETDTFSVNGEGVSKARIFTANETNYLLAITDSSGKVEWKTGAVQSTILTVEASLKI